MHKHRITLLLLTLVGGVLLTALSACASAEPAPAEFQDPIVTLDRVEVAHYWPYLLDTKGQVPGFEGVKHGAPLDLAYVFNVENPNDYDVMLDTLRFTVTFENTDLMLVTAFDDSWIPAHRTNQVRVHATLDAYTAVLSLLVTGGFALQEKGLSGPEQIQTWWEGVPDFAFPIKASAGTAEFTSEGGDTLVAFEGQHP